LILKKINKLVATRCHRPILKLKCAKFDFGWSSAPDPARETYSAPPDPLAGFKGPTSNGKEGRKDGRMEGQGRRRRGPISEAREEEKRKGRMEGRGELCKVVIFP